MVADQLKQRRSIQLREGLAQFLAVGTTFCKSAALAAPQCGASVLNTLIVAVPTPTYCSFGFFKTNH
jgi:hypothetical protein